MAMSPDRTRKLCRTQGLHMVIRGFSDTLAPPDLDDSTFRSRSNSAIFGIGIFHELRKTPVALYKMADLGGLLIFKRPPLSQIRPDTTSHAVFVLLRSPRGSRLLGTRSDHRVFAY
jgi:hypothetical protein